MSEVNWRARAEAAEADLRGRELHHFETEQENATLHDLLADAEWLIRTDHGVGRHDSYGFNLSCKGCAWLAKFDD